MSKATTKTRTKAVPKKAEKIRLDASKLIEKSRTGIILTGRVVDGKVVIDQSALDRVSKQFPGAEISFVAVNAPFDPTTQLS